MEGTILNFDEETSSGLILGEDKERYFFSKDNWKAEKIPVSGLKTDFVPKEGQALEIYPLPNSSFGEISSERKKIMANEKTGPTIVYACFLISFVIGITLIIGGIFAYVKKDGSSEWLESHYKYQIRTFWNVLIGSIIGFSTIPFGVGMVILIILGLWFVYRIIKGWVRLSKGMAV